MKDPRNRKLAQNLIDYSVSLKPGEMLYLEIKGKEALALGEDIIEHASQKGGAVFWSYSDESLMRQCLKSASEAQMEKLTEIHLSLMKKAAA